MFHKSGTAGTKIGTPTSMSQASSYMDTETMDHTQLRQAGLSLLDKTAKIASQVSNKSSHRRSSAHRRNISDPMKSSRKESDFKDVFM